MAKKCELYSMVVEQERDAGARRGGEDEVPEEQDQAGARHRVLHAGQRRDGCHPRTRQHSCQNFRSGQR